MAARAQDPPRFLGYSPAYYVGYGYGGNYGRPFYAYGGPINRHVVAHCYHNSH